MSVKGILFNTEMVRAILDGRKTVTRRLIKPRYRDDEYSFQIVTNANTGEFVRVEIIDEYESCTRALPPQYLPGDILYVRETWQKHRIRKPLKAIPSDFKEIQYSYLADGELANIDGSPFKWRPSIHMPKEAARIFLRVTAVRAERLQKCGEGWCIDIEKEGVKTPQNPILYVNDDIFHDALRAEMEKLWDSTIKKEDRPTYGWEANPWVWVYEF